MSIIPKKDKQTDIDEADRVHRLLRRDAHDDLTKAFLTKHKGQMADVAEGWANVARAAQSLYMGKRAIYELAKLEDEIGDAAEARKALNVLARENRELRHALEATGREKDAEISRLTAAPAAVVHSDD